MQLPSPLTPLRSRVLFAGALVYAVGLVVAALTAPVYSSTSGFGAVTSETLVQVNGRGVLGVVAIPLLGSLIVVVNETSRRRRGRRAPGTFSYVVVGVIAAVSVLGALTVGLFFLPVPILLWIALAVSKGHV